MNKHFPEHHSGVVLVMMCSTGHDHPPCRRHWQMGLFERDEKKYYIGKGYIYDYASYDMMRHTCHTTAHCHSKLKAWLGALKECNRLNAACLRYRHRWEGVSDE